MLKAHAIPRLASGILLVALLSLPLITDGIFGSAYAERYQSRLSTMLNKKTELYMPARLIIGEEAKFVVRAQPGNHVKVFLSPKSEGMELSDGLLLRVGEAPEVLSGTIPENGVLELKMTVPNNEALLGKVLYVDAAAGATEDTLAPLSLIDATGRKAETNGLTITKHTAANGSPIMPYMQGVSPQLFNQLTTLGDIYTKKDDHRKDLLDNGSINQNRQLDKNPFTNRGFQPGIQQ